MSEVPMHDDEFENVFGYRRPEASAQDTIERLRAELAAMNADRDRLREDNKRLLAELANRNEALKLARKYISRDCVR